MFKQSFFKTFMLLAALVCSLGIYAVDWSTISFLGDGAGGGAYSNKYKATGDCTPVNVQQPGTPSPGIYMTLSDAAFGEVRIGGAAADYNPMGAAICIYLSNFTAQETEVQVMNSENTAVRWTINVFYVDGTAAPATPTSEYCSQVFQSGQNSEALFTWETLSNGNIQVTLAEPDGSVNANTHFRGNGIKLAQMTVGSEAGSEYFTASVSNTSNIQTFVLKDGKSIPVGTTITVASAVVEYAVANNTNAWPSFGFSYTYGGVCPSNYPMESVSLNKATITLETGKTFKLETEFTPSYATNKNVTWQSSDESVATVVNGVVTSVNPGTATITVTTEDGNKTASCEVTVIAKLSQCYGDLGHFATPSNAKMHYEIVYADGKVNVTATGIANPLDFAEIHIVGVGNFPMTADGSGGYTFQRTATVGDKWYFRFLYSDTSMGGNEMTSQDVSASDANIRYYIVGDCPAPYQASNEDYTKLTGVTATASSERASAHPISAGFDADVDTYWESVWDTDPQTYTIDLGKECVFNSVIVKFGAHRASKYDVLVSRDGENFTTIATDQVGVNNEDVSTGVSPTIGRYIRLNLKSRGNGYGYDIKNVQVKYVENSVLTTLTTSIADKFLKAGQNYTISVDARDQYNLTMTPGTVTYTVTPAAMGSIVDGVFHVAADAHGEVTINANVEAVVAPALSKFIVQGSNLALNNAMDGVGTYSEEHGPARAVDGVENTEWQGRPAGAEGTTYDAWFVVDLGNTYDIDMMSIHFEGACSDAYHIDFSSNNSTWNTGYSFAQTMGVNNHTDIIGNFTNNIQVRYVRFWSTKASTGYGMKIYELQVFGTLNEADPMYNLTASVTPAASGSVAIKNGDDVVAKAVSGTTITYTATAAPNFAFSKWSDDNTDNPRTIVVASADVALEAVFSRTSYGMTATSSKEEWGTAAVSAASVAPAGSVTFTATPTGEDYVFVNWTDGEGNVVSTAAQYVINGVAADYALTANFDYRRDVYCHKAITSNNGKKLYLTIGQTSTPGIYQIKYEGSEEATLTGINNANFTINQVRTEIASEAEGATKQEGQDVVFNMASGRWQFSAEGYGSAWINFSVAAGKTWEDIYAWNANIYFATNHGEQGYTWPNAGQMRYHIDWNNTCSDNEAPVLAAPTADALNTTDIRLTLSATDNWDGTITYIISRDGAADIQTTGASGVNVTYDVTGLASDATYTFNIVAQDAAGNASAARSCNASLSAAGDVTAPTNVTVSAKPLTDTSVELTLFADDDYDGDITYDITYAGGSANTSAARGTTTKYTVTGLTASTEYTFSVVAKDAVPNSAAAVSANVTTFSGNLALNKPATAGGDALAIASANNNNLGDRWASGGGDMAKNWWAVNLGDVYDVKNIRISFEGACPTVYDLMASYDGENYTVIQHYASTPNSNANGALAWNEYPVNAQARYLKIQATAATFNNAYGISMWEFQAYGTPAVDNVAPVVTGFTGNGTSPSSIELHAQATDNFCGTLTYIFYSNAEVELGRVENVAYGSEAVYLVSGLTEGSHTFKVKAFDGVNYSAFQTVTAETVTDTQAPTGLAVAITNVTPYAISLEMSATDDKGGAITYAITWNGGSHEVSAASGATANYTIEGLSYSTNYTISVVARDGAGNASAPVVKNQKTLRADFPLVAASEPLYPSALVKPVYSVKYGKTNCNWQLTSWGNNATRDNQTVGQKINFNSSGYIGIDNFSYALTANDYIFMQVWSDVDNTIDVYPIARNEANTGNCSEKYIRVSLVGGQWNTINLKMGDFDLDYLGNIYQIKIAGAQNQILWFDNILFHSPVTLDETVDNTSVLSTYNTETVDVVFNRSFVADGYWYTLCLPFDMTSAQVTEAFGSCTIAKMTGSEMRGDMLHIDFAHVTNIQAGMPYLFMPAANVVNPTIQGVTINSTASTVNATALAKMTGFYAPTVVTAPNLFLGDDNYLKTNNDASATKAFRAYFTLTGVPAGVRAKVVFNGQIATDVEDLEVAEGEVQKIFRNGQIYILKGDKVYTVQGQLVE